MDNEQKQRYLQLKEELVAIEQAIDGLHEEEASILAEIDALEREASKQQLPELEHQLLTAFTQLIAAGSAMAQVALDLHIPPTVFEPVLRPHEYPTPTADTEQKKAS